MDGKIRPFSLMISHISIGFPLGNLYAVFLPLSLFTFNIVIEYVVAESFFNKRISLSGFNSFLKSSGKGLKLLIGEVKHVIVNGGRRR